jgi:hypothetical protein
MRVIPVTEQEAKTTTPKPFNVADSVQTLVERIGADQAKLAAELLMKAVAENPDARYFSIVVEPWE